MSASPVWGRLGVLEIHVVAVDLFDVASQRTHVEADERADRIGPREQHRTLGHARGQCRHIAPCVVVRGAAQLGKRQVTPLDKT